jgi:hypothetical protein
MNEGNRVDASRKRWHSPENAKKYAKTVSPSRVPKVEKEIIEGTKPIWFYVTMIMLLGAFIQATWILFDNAWISGIVNTCLYGVMAWFCYTWYDLVETYNKIANDAIEQGYKNLFETRRN